MTVIEKISCPNCGETLKGWHTKVHAPGIKETMNCPKCGANVVVRNDPSFNKASAGKKVSYAIGWVYSVGVVVLSGFLAVSAFQQGHPGMALFFAGLGIAFAWAIHA